MIARQLVDSGILQFGIFMEQGKRVPYQLHLEMIPAYPELFGMVVDAVIDKLPDKAFDRLVAHSDCAVVTGAIAYKTGISLVYSRGSSTSPVHDLVGAYDVGHPACLLLNTIPDNIEKFIAGCRQVGLEINSIVSLIVSQEHILDIPVIAVYSLESMLAELYETGDINDSQQQAILKHLTLEKEIAQSTD
jgi:hypothetical protein